MTMNPEASTPGNISRRTFLNLGIATLAGVAVGTTFGPRLENWSESSPEIAKTPEELWNECNKGSQALVRAEKLDPKIGPDGAPDFTRSLESLNNWGGIGKSEQGELTSYFQLAQDALQEDFVKLISDSDDIEPFPDSTIIARKMGKKYTKNEHEKRTTYILRRNNWPIDSIDFKDDFHDAISLWENKMEPHITPQTRILLSTLRRNYNSNVQIGTTEGYFKYCNFGIQYPHSNEDFPIKVFGRELNINYKHSADTLGALAHALPREANVMQMTRGDLAGFLNDRAERIKQGSKPPFTVIYYPYRYTEQNDPDHPNKSRNDEALIHNALEGIDVDELGVMIIASTGNEGEVTPIKRKIPKGVICVTSLRKTGEFSENRNIIPDENTENRQYAFSEELPSINIYPTLHRSTSGECTMHFGITPNTTEGTSYSGLKATMIVSLIASDRYNKGLPVTTSLIEKELQNITRTRHISKDNQQFTIREMDFDKFKERFNIEDEMQS